MACFSPRVEVTSLYGAVAAGAAAAVEVCQSGRAQAGTHARRSQHRVLRGLRCDPIALRPGHLDTWGRYAQAGSHVALTLAVFGSILAGRPSLRPTPGTPRPNPFGTPTDSTPSTDGSPPFGVWPFSSGPFRSSQQGPSMSAKSSYGSSFRSAPSTAPTCSPRSRSMGSVRQTQPRSRKRTQVPGDDLPGYIEASASWRSAQAIALLVADSVPSTGHSVPWPGYPNGIRRMAGPWMNLWPTSSLQPSSTFVPSRSTGTPCPWNHRSGTPSWWRWTRAFGRTPSMRGSDLPLTATSSPGSMELFAEYFTALWN